MKKVMVFGSFAVDLMGRAPHLPLAGETVKGSLFKMGPGGKGFNQGVAAHKSGADITMITKLGKDSFANIALDLMNELNMDKSHLLFSDNSATGTSLILVDENSSQNSILMIPGACDTITDEEVLLLSNIMPNYSFLLTQLETNISSIEKIITLAYEKDIKVILNPAPVQSVNVELLKKLYLITPNELEAESLTGIKIEDENSAHKASELFFSNGVENVIITLGNKGVYVNTKNKKGIIDPCSVKALDTTGAGDCFNGALLTALSEGKNIWEAARFANIAAALSVQKMGAALSMPTRTEIDKFIIN